MQSPALVVSLDQYDIDAVHEWCRTAHVFRRHRPIEFNGHYEIDADAVREARGGVLDVVSRSCGAAFVACEGRLSLITTTRPSPTWRGIIR